MAHLPNFSGCRRYSYHNLRDNTNHPTSNNATQTEPSKPLPPFSTQHSSIPVPHYVPFPHPIFLFISCSGNSIMCLIFFHYFQHFSTSLTNSNNNQSQHPKSTIPSLNSQLFKSAIKVSDFQESGRQLLWLHFICHIALFTANPHRQLPFIILHPPTNHSVSDLLPSSMMPPRTTVHQTTFHPAFHLNSITLNETSKSEYINLMFGSILHTYPPLDLIVKPIYSDFNNKV